MVKKAKVVKEKSIEDRIWDSANKLRGNLTASEYQNVVLGLVFLKYISDSFEKRYQELVEEGDGFEEDRDEYTAEHVFWVPQDTRWNVIASKAHSPEIGQVIDHALEEIGKLGDLFAESHRLEAGIREKLAGIGWKRTK